MKVTLNIPDDLAERLGAPANLERELLQSLALQAFKRGDLKRKDVARLLGLNTTATDQFLAARGTLPEHDDDARATARQAVENIIARRKGMTLGDLKIKDLINEGRP